MCRILPHDETNRLDVAILETRRIEAARYGLSVLVRVYALYRHIDFEVAGTTLSPGRSALVQLEDLGAHLQDSSLPCLTVVDGDYIVLLAQDIKVDTSDIMLRLTSLELCLLGVIITLILVLLVIIALCAGGVVCLSLSI